jgi:hypothetical protein
MVPEIVNIGLQENISTALCSTGICEGTRTILVCTYAEYLLVITWEYSFTVMSGQKNVPGGMGKLP